jgi:imidazolonepropionase
MKQQADMLITGASEVLTCVPQTDDLIGRIKNGAVAITGERIAAVGSASDVSEQADVTSAQVIDATGKIVAPGFVDCHTHLVFGGSRAREFAARMTHTATEVKAMGIPVGILATVEMTRRESIEELTSSAHARLQRMLAAGTTTVESKSGYGLSLEHELKQLEVNRRLQDIQPVDIVSTFLGAHEFPLAVARERYVEEVIQKQIPAVAEKGLAAYCDVYCDQGVYNLDESRRILEAGLASGLKPKIHVDAYANIGGSSLAADLQAVSADHLNYTSREEMAKLAAAGTIAVIMPALDFAVDHPRPFDGRAMIDEGLTLALATDICPGCWVESMQFVMMLACRRYKLSPEEALLASTCGAAQAINLDNDRGTLEAGKLADIQIWDIPTFEDLIYRLGNNSTETVIKRGRIVLHDTASNLDQNPLIKKEYLGG